MKSSSSLEDLCICSAYNRVAVVVYAALVLLNRLTGASSSRRLDVSSYHHAWRSRASTPEDPRPAYLTPTGYRGPRLLWLLCAEFSESMCALSPLPALALALPVRLRLFTGPLGRWRALTPACCSTCCGATVLPCPGGYCGIGCLTPPGGDGRPFGGYPMWPLGGEGRPLPRPSCGL